jgi:acyl-CoA thioesterase-1
MAGIVPVPAVLPVEVSSMWAFRARGERLRPHRSRTYRQPAGAVQPFACRASFTIAWAAALLGAIAVATRPLDAAEREVKIVALGDSLTAGLGLSANQAFPAKLAQALRRKGIPVEVANAGVSGDTAADGAARLDWSVPEGTDAVIVELGANDALRGIDPQRTRAALEKILRRLAERHVAVLLAGMRAPRNLGGAYVEAFDAIFPELASAFGVALYPFFLEGVATERALNQPDGLHPTAAGVDAIVARMLPAVEALVAKVRADRGS